MTMLTSFIMLALLLTIAALVTGIVSMAQGGEYDRKHSVQIMGARVGLQGLTLVLLIVALVLAVP